MSKFNVSTSIHMLLGSLPCLHLDLYAFRPLAMFTLRSACLCSLSCLRLDLHATELRISVVLGGSRGFAFSL